MNADDNIRIGTLVPYPTSIRTDEHRRHRPLTGSLNRPLILRERFDLRHATESRN